MNRTKVMKRRRHPSRNRTSKRKPTEITNRRSRGRKKKFDRERLASTTARSGVPFLMARDVAIKVTKRVKTESRGVRKKLVTGHRIRGLIRNELRSRIQVGRSEYVGSGPQQSSERKARSQKLRDGNTEMDLQRNIWRAGYSIIHDKSKRLTSRH